MHENIVTKPSLIEAYDNLNNAYRANAAIIDMLSQSTNNEEISNLAILLNMVLADFKKGMNILSEATDVK